MSTGKLASARDGGVPRLPPSTIGEASHPTPGPDFTVDPNALEAIKEVESPLCPALTVSGAIERGGELAISSPCGRLQASVPKVAKAEEYAGPQAGLFACAEEPSGIAWGIVIHLGKQDSIDYSGDWRVVRQAPDGSKQQSRAVAYAGSAVNMNDSNAPPTCLGFSDFNGDGQQELVAIGRETINNAGAEKRVQIWVASQGKVTNYEPSRQLVAFGLADVDGDGRTDLAVNPYAASSRTPTFPKNSYPTHSRFEWSLLAHGERDGSFSLDSAVSRRYAEVLCPNAPKATLPQDPNQWPSHIHCARLWAQPVEPYAAQINERCSNANTPELQSVCQHGIGFLEVELQRKLPLRLGK
jgi:hypothetical protein